VVKAIDLFLRVRSLHQSYWFVDVFETTAAAAAAVVVVR
jgi:hypothetical protein